MSKPEKGAPRISPELLAKAKGSGDNPRISPELLEKAAGNPRISPELLAKGGDNPRISPELLANRENPATEDQPAPAAVGRPEGGKPGGSRRPPNRAKQSVPISVFLGILLVPLSAAASLFLVSPQEDQADAATEAAVESVEATGADALAQDLATACGPAGAQLVEMETAGTLTDLQQAALDALRPICDQNGLALPDAPSDSATAGTVVVTASNSGGPAPAASSAGSDDHGDDWDDDDWDDDHDDDDDDDWDDDHDDDDDRDDD